jgi:hypothetical protein
MATPNKDELSTTAKAIGCSIDDFHATAPVRLYRSNGSSWEYTGSWGIVGVTFDQGIGAAFLRVVDLGKKQVVLDQETYKDFEYQVLSPCMHAFEADDAVYGLNFAESFDANSFYLKLKGVLALSNAPLPKVSTKTTTVPHTASEPKKITTSNKTNASTKSSSSGGGGWFGGFFGGKKEEPKRPKISGAKNFVHVAHLGFSGKNGFGNIPPEWKAIFDKAGVTEEELKDAKTARFIMKTIVSAGDVKLSPPPSLDTPTRDQPPLPPKGAPPPVPTRTTPPTKGPPPPPPTAQNTGAGSPPPPPPPPAAALNSGTSPASSAAFSAPTDMLTQIREKKLKKVTVEDIPKVSEMGEEEQNSLAAKIQQAMSIRRTAVVDDSDSDDEDWEI